MKVLDLYCGGGGAGMGYHQAGFEVVGVDIVPQPHYPFEFIQSDALEAFQTIGGQFDLIHASPPCQLYTKKPANWSRKRVHFHDTPDFLEPTRTMLEESDVLYVLENVVGAPIRPDLMLCGTMFGLRIIKHRLFEANWQLPIQPEDGDHKNTYNPWSGKGRTANEFRIAQGTPWLPMTGGESRKRGETGDLYNAIPPAYTKYIGEGFLKL